MVQQRKHSVHRRTETRQVGIHLLRLRLVSTWHSPDHNTASRGSALFYSEAVPQDHDKIVRCYLSKKSASRLAVFRQGARGMTQDQHYRGRGMIESRFGNDARFCRSMGVFSLTASSRIAASVARPLSVSVAAALAVVHEPTDGPSTASLVLDSDRRVVDPGCDAEQDYAVLCSELFSRLCHGLLPPPAFRERGHRGLTCRLVAVR